MGTAPKTIKIDDLIPDPRNARVHSGKNIDAISESLIQYGAGRSIVIDGDGIVRAGNGTLEAAKEAGIEKVVVIDSDGKTLVAVRRADWSPLEAAGYGLADNKTAELAKWDKDQLREIFAELSGNDELIVATGFSEDEISKLLGEPKPEPEPIDVSFQAHPKTGEVTCPKCGFQWEE